VTTVKTLRSFLADFADALKIFGHDILTGQTYIFEKLNEQRIMESNEYFLENTM